MGLRHRQDSLARLMMRIYKARLIVYFKYSIDRGLECYIDFIRSRA